jgi:hypothetical protein
MKITYNDYILTPVVYNDTFKTKIKISATRHENTKKRNTITLVA